MLWYIIKFIIIWHDQSYNGCYNQYRDFRGIHVCGIVYHVCGIVYHICGNFDPQMWYSMPHMWYTQNFYFWILTMIPMPKIQKSFKQYLSHLWYAKNYEFWIFSIIFMSKIQKSILLSESKCFGISLRYTVLQLWYT